MTGRGASWRRVKRHRSYTVSEAANVTGVTNLTVRRWFRDDLPALKEKRPTLILGADLIAYLRNRRKTKTPLRLNELHCFKCRCARLPAGDMLEFVQHRRKARITGLCCECLTVMNKAFSASRLAELRRLAEVSFAQGAPHLSESTKPLVNDHFQQEPRS